MNRLPVAAKVFLTLLFLGLGLIGLIGSFCGGLFSAMVPDHKTPFIIAGCIVIALLSLVLPVWGLWALFRRTAPQKSD